VARASPIQSSFNGGEFSPRLEGRVDVAKYATACKLLEGFIPLIQGPAQRRGGFRYLGEVKDSSKRTWLVRFEFNTTQAYQLEFGDRYIRFWANHGQVIVSGVAAYNNALPYSIGDLATSGGVTYYCIAATTGNAPPNATYWYALTGSIYEIPSPYTTADLTNADGTFALRVVQSADVIYIAHSAYPPRKLSRLGATDWTLQTVTFAGGPFKTENITATTIYASAATGAVTLTASTAVFSASLVGSLLQLKQKSVLDVKAWEAGAVIAAGAERHSDGKNYVALNNATTGPNKPTHSSGAAYDGDAGVQWQYEDPGFGCVLLTGYTDTTHMTGTVVSPFPANPSSQLPSNCVGVGNATTRWALAAWSSVEGWPTQVSFFRERLCFGRKTKAWLSVVGDYEVFTALDQSGIITADMAISLTLQSSKVNDMQWMESISSSVDALVCGTAGSEFAIKSMTENQPFGTDNNTATMISTLGSRNTVPVHVGNVLLFVQRAGSKLRDVSYDFYSNQFQSIDQSVMAEHIPRVGVDQIVFQQEPYSLVWAVRADGLLVCMTYSREQYPDAPHGGWHRHGLGGSGIVEAVSVIPAPDDSRDELWAITKRTINGATKRYVEFMDWERKPNDDPEDAFYVDCGLTLDNTVNATLTPGTGALVQHTEGVAFTAGSATFVPGDVGRQIHYRYSTTDSEGVVTYATSKATITAYNTALQVTCTVDAAFPSMAAIAAGAWRLTVTTISGLGHLEGQTVDVLVNGATHPQRTVSGGAITLQTAASKVQVGLAFPTKLQTLRFNAGAQDGTSQGKKAVVSSVVVRLLETLGLKYGATFDDMFDIDFRSALDLMDNPPPIFSGDITLDWPGDYNTTPWLCFQQDQPLPATIVGLMPQVGVSDKG
jgi:hypothetical protein